MPDTPDPATESRVVTAETLVRQLQGLLGGVAVKRGTGTCTWTASATSAATVVSHGLPTTPTSVLTASRNVPAEYAVTARDATTFTVTGYTTTGVVITNTLTFDWVALS